MKHFQRNDIFFWLPRILGIVFIGFLGIFALDVFEPGRTWWYIFGAFFMHLLPNYILLIALVVAWKKELLGGILFLFIGAMGTIFSQTYTYVWTFLMISLPVFLIGVLFIWDYFLRKKKEYTI